MVDLDRVGVKKASNKIFSTIKSSNDIIEELQINQDKKD
jgi:hypothetical protein